MAIHNLAQEYREKMISQSIGKNSAILAGFALATAFVLAFTHHLTAEKIAASERRAAQKALLELVPLSRHNNDMLADSRPLTQQEQRAFSVDDSQAIYYAKQNDEQVALVVPSVAPDGYSGAIKLIIGINIDGSLAGVRVLSHKETPGLGDKIDLKKHDWILSFSGKSLQNPSVEDWKVKKDGGVFDQFTGATITPRAVVNRVRETLSYVAQHKAELLNADSHLNAEKL